MPLGENQKLVSRPELREWLSMPCAELATYVLPRKLAMMVSIDGTQRHYLLNTPAENARISDYDAYARHNANAYARVFNLLFALGVHSVLTTMLFPPNFQRDEASLRRMMAMSQIFLTKEPFATVYRDHQAQARLFGDYDLAQAATPIRKELQTLDNEIAALTPGRERLLLLGYCAGSFADEQIARTLQLRADLNRSPTADELRLACFPHGPDRIDIYVAAGWLRVGGVLPPLLDKGATDIYILSHLALDLTEYEARRILYDHLFLRWAANEDRVGYSPEDLAVLPTFYDTHRDHVTGVGQLVGPGLWYPTDPSALEHE